MEKQKTKKCKKCGKIIHSEVARRFIFNHDGGFCIILRPLCYQCVIILCKNDHEMKKINNHKDLEYYDGHYKNNEK